MGNYELSQWADYMRVLSPRRKERHRKIGVEKYLLRLNRERKEIWKKKRNQPIVPLEKPYQRGWVRNFVLREDIAQSGKATFYTVLLEKINTESYSHTRTFKKTVRRRGKKVKEVRPQYLKEFSEWEWLKCPSLLSEEEKTLFFEREVWYCHGKLFQKYYSFSEPWRYTLKVRPNMITHTQQADGELESAYSRLINRIDNKMEGKIIKLTNGRKEAWRTCREVQPKYRCKKKSLLQMLEQIENEQTTV